MSETYPNAPLVQAVFQARFPGETAVEVARPKIQAGLRNDLPQLFVPKAAIDVAPMLQPVVLKAADETEAFEFAINSFGYSTTSYAGFDRFKEQLLKFAAVFASAVPEVNALNRVGLRYINKMPLLRENNEAPIPVADYLNLGLMLPESIPQVNLTELNSVFSVRLDDGVLRVAVRTEERSTPAEREVLVLDFDYILKNNITMSNLETYVESAHRHTKRVFHDLLAPSYLAFVKGDLA